MSMPAAVTQAPAREGLRYTEEEKSKLNRLANAIDTIAEMEHLAPFYAQEMQRSVGAIQHQIENRKTDFFWKR